MKLEFGKPESKVEFTTHAKHEAAVKKALLAMKQTGIGVVKRCDICKEWPYKTSLNSWPCCHRLLYDASLRGFGIAVLNDAARSYMKDPEGIPW